MILPNPPIHTSKDSGGMQSWFQQLWQKFGSTTRSIPDFGVQLGTVVATTSGTSHDFTVPAGTRRVTMNLVGVSGNGTSKQLIQLGDSGGIETTNYLGASSDIAAGVTTSNFTTGFGIQTGAAAVTLHGTVIFVLVNSSTNTWAASGVLGRSDNAVTITVGGTKSLSAELTTVRLTHLNGTDTFDAGSVNIAYEF